MQETNNRLFPHKKGDGWDGAVVKYTDDNDMPVDLTGYTAISQFKVNKNGTAIMTFTTADGTLTIPNPIDGKIYYAPRIIDIPAAIYLFDLQIRREGGMPKTIASGILEVKQDISH